jgi:hypothetical protein
VRDSNLRFFENRATGSLRARRNNPLSLGLSERLLDQGRLDASRNGILRRIFRVFASHPALNKDSPKRTLPTGRPMLMPGSNRTTAVDPR